MLARTPPLLPLGGLIRLLESWRLESGRGLAETPAGVLLLISQANQIVVFEERNCDC